MALPALLTVSSSVEVAIFGAPNVATTLADQEILFKQRCRMVNAE
jgi:hypothetical protein